MVSTPASMKAVLTTGESDRIHLTNAPVPKPGSGQILVKVIAAAQNPSEWMKLGLSAKNPAANIPVGHDFAGIVAAIGPDVPAGLRTIGERIAGFVNGCLAADLGGTFAEYTLADAQVVISIPESLSFEDAATLGLAGYTACQTLWQSLTLPTPLEPTKEHLPILIWGGATTVGQYAIQLAKLSGLHVVSTASSTNYQLLKDLGVDEVFDYHDPEISQKIRQATNGKLTYVIDCVATAETVRMIGDCIGDEGGYLASVLHTDVPRDNIKADFPFVYTLLGKAISSVILPPSLMFPAIQEHFELGKKFSNLLTQLLAEGKLKTTPVKLVPNGLQDVQYWVEYQRQGKVRAEKIVYRISDTPGL